MKSISIESRIFKYDNPSLTKFFTSVKPYVPKINKWAKVREEFGL